MDGEVWRLTTHRAASVVRPPWCLRDVFSLSVARYNNCVEKIRKRNFRGCFSARQFTAMMAMGWCVAVLMVDGKFPTKKSGQPRAARLNAMSSPEIRRGGVGLRGAWQAGPP